MSRAKKVANRLVPTALAQSQRAAKSLPKLGDLQWRLDGRRLLAHQVKVAGPTEVSQANYRDVLSVADRSGVRLFAIPVPAGWRWRFGIRSSQWQAFADELSGGERPSGRRIGVVHDEQFRLLRGNPSAAKLASERVLRIFTPVCTPESPVSFGQRFAVEIERWEEAGDGSLSGPRNNDVGSYVPPELTGPAMIREQGFDRPTLQVFDCVPTDRVTFDIDAVYTWVDGDDRAWRARRDEAGAGVDGDKLLEPTDRDARYRQRDELRYSIRSIQMYAPWIRHIWIVTDRQIPAWLNPEVDGITVVDHRDLWPDAGEGLPTFNSHAIEARLHHIDGLSEHFLYLNDDFMLARPVAPELFFDANGISHFFPSPVLIPPGPPLPGETTPVLANRNIRSLLAADFDQTIRYTFKHVPHPINRGVMLELEKRYPAQFDHLLRSRFRSADDVAPISLSHHYAFLTAQGVPEPVEYKYVNLGSSNVRRVLTQLLAEANSWDCFCVNDSHDGNADDPELAMLLERFLQARFPVPSRFELEA